MHGKGQKRSGSFKMKLKGEEASLGSETLLLDTPLEASPDEDGSELEDCSDSECNEETALQLMKEQMMAIKNKFGPARLREELEKCQEELAREAGVSEDQTDSSTERDSLSPAPSTTRKRKRCDSEESLDSSRQKTCEAIECLLVGHGAPAFKKCNALGCGPFHTMRPFRRHMKGKYKAHYCTNCLSFRCGDSTRLGEHFYKCVRNQLKPKELKQLKRMTPLEILLCSKLLEERVTLSEIMAVISLGCGGDGCKVAACREKVDNATLGRTLQLLNIRLEPEAAVAEADGTLLTYTTDRAAAVQDNITYGNSSSPVENQPMHSNLMAQSNAYTIPLVPNFVRAPLQEIGGNSGTMGNMISDSTVPSEVLTNLGSVSPTAYSEDLITWEDSDGGEGCGLALFDWDTFNQENDSFSAPLLV